MRSFSFWQKWLFVTGLALIAFGLALALFSRTPLFDMLFNGHINPAFWPTVEPSPDIVRFQQWSYGVLGATVAGWGVMVAFLAGHPFRRKERWARNALAASVALWYTVDTALSVHHGVLFNAVFNTILLVVTALPLLFTRRDFR
jgi:hypothetical protein